jgi:hypothetical protein
LRQIAQIPASYQDDEYDERPRGLFLVSHDVDGMSEWRVHIVKTGGPEPAGPRGDAFSGCEPEHGGRVLGA